MKQENHVKVVESFNSYCLFVDVEYYGLSVTKIADLIQEYGADFLNVLEVRYTSETKTGTVIVKEKGKMHKQDFEKIIDNIFQTICKEYLNSSVQEPGKAADLT